MIIRRARPTDYPAILQLQGENVPEALDERQNGRDLSYRA